MSKIFDLLFNWNKSGGDGVIDYVDNGSGTYVPASQQPGQYQRRGVTDWHNDPEAAIFRRYNAINRTSLPYETSEKEIRKAQSEHPYDNASV